MTSFTYMNPLTAHDGYKADHRRQYPDGTQMIFSNLTARSGKHSNVPADYSRGAFLFGLQIYLDRLVREWEDNFFNVDKDIACAEYHARMSGYLGGDFDVSHIEALWDLGYLPLEVRALPEGTLVPYRVPMLTIHNTDTRFFWLTNFIETDLSAEIWKTCTSLTTAFFYLELLHDFAFLTGGSTDMIPIQAHDFSYRGMSGRDDAAKSGAAHLMCFLGTDTLPAIDLIETHYGVDTDGPIAEPIGVSVPATEHSVMCAGGQETEAETYDRLITEVYPTGIVSIVSDTWDFWSILDDYLTSRREMILARDGKVVIRPDSGDPVKIICGDPDAPVGSSAHKGAVERLYEIFGGTTNEEGYRTLAPQIGLIYGDSITPQRAYDILMKLSLKGFASDNIVMGVGSYTYNYVTRDTHGFAVKATYALVNGEGRKLFKDPKTDDGVKRSLKGLFRVYVDEDGELQVEDDRVDTEGCLMDTVFLNGKILRRENYVAIRKRIKAQLDDASSVLKAAE